ncbi:MAG TPA: hypothetical protein VFR31_19260 [Thermoanaerobaculia bacterium]|nr:hypothetical protein [Thermoanaerobaculia bacterium]
MMKRSLSTVLLLAAFALGFLSGPHPCVASHEKKESARPSCHETQPAPDAPDEDGSGCGDSCQHACHMTAIAEAEPVTFSMSPVAKATDEPSGSGLPLFAHPIDHIPLA